VISGNGPTLVPITKDGSSLAPIFWFDDSAPPFSKNMPGILPEYKSFFLPKVKAFAEKRQVDYERTDFFLSPQEWLSWRLGASPVPVIPHAAYEPYYWDSEQCEAFGLHWHKFTPLQKMGSVIGKTKSGISPLNSEGVPGVPLAAAGPDFIMALIGTGVLEPGMCCDRTGSSEGINVCLAEKPGGEFFNLRILPHAVEGFWNAGAVIPRSGKQFDDFLAAFSSSMSGLTTDEILERLILGSPLDGVSQADRSGRTVLEKMAGELSAAIRSLEIARFPVGELVLSGGQAKNPLWNQYKADMTGRIFLEPEIIDAELGGDAVLGALILKGGSLKERAAEMIRIKKRYTPAHKGVTIKEKAEEIERDGKG
jgi:xylulokinase